MRIRGFVLWVVAFAVTLGLAVWQRASGPSYPARGRVTIGGSTVRLELPRSGDSGEDLSVRIPVTNPGVSGELAWRRFPTVEPWRVEPLRRDRGELVGALPSQPKSGKVEYQVRLFDGAGKPVVFPLRPAIARFKGKVPVGVLAPHILAMFLALLFAARAGLGAVVGGERLAPKSWVTLALVIVGGFILGPIVQRFAFDAWWTGVPFGVDLTDNKTAIAAIVWGWALWRQRGGRPARAAVLVAALVMLVVFSIPHSVWGSQLDWDRTAGAAARTSGQP